ncbi:MAG: hypothetical protein K8W52_32490 [Deltaproteobacteria bacterium]|nr:hypothetical protein [Deltaproteobacteria bacterium]
MANSRRGSGRGSFGSARSDLRGTLSTLVRSTLAQAGVVRDVIERGAREGRARLEGVQLDRRHTDALAALGEAVLELVRSGDLADLEDVPAIADAIATIEDLEAQRADRGAPGGGPAKWRRERDDGDELRAAIDRDLAPKPRGRGTSMDDGTVSSGARPRAAAPAPAAKPARPEPRVWRPSAPPDDVTRDLKGPREAGAPEPGAKFREAPRRAGGIQFDRADDGPGPDDDLAEYMHPDDVPPR